MSPDSQVDSSQQWFWVNVLSTALHRLATAADPLVPWLALQVAGNPPLLHGLRNGTLSMAEVRSADATILGVRSKAIKGVYNQS